MAIFTRRSLAGEELRIYGDGSQTRDLLYVEDCARFVGDALSSDAAVGRILNAGTGVDVSVNELAATIEPDPDADRARRAHPPPERDRRPALRRAAGSDGPGLATGDIARGGAGPDPDVDGGPLGRRHTRRVTTERSGRDRGRPCQLAVNGGTPVRNEFLPYAHQQITDDDVAAVAGALRSDWLTTGPRVPAFEAALADATGARHAVAYSSGTAALHGATVAAGLSRATRRSRRPDVRRHRECRALTGAEPQFADVEAGTLLIDPSRVADAITTRTRAMLPVDYAGQPADYDALRAIADAGPAGPLAIIADASHALGARRAGRRRDARRHDVFSFHPAKILTTGEGGAVLTDRDDLADRLRRFRNHGIATELAARTDWIYAMVELGYNYRLTDIGAALGSSQLGGSMRSWPADASSRPTIERVSRGTRDRPPGSRSRDGTGLASVGRTASARSPRCDRGVVYRAMRAEGIGVNVHYIPVHQHPYYRERYPGLALPVAEAAYARLLTLPLHAGHDRRRGR